MANTEIKIHELRNADHAGVVAIYNYYVEHSPCTFDTQSFSVGQRADWFAQFHDERYLCLIAEQQNNVIGYACAQAFKVKPAYATSVEVSVYIDADATQKGIGRQLYQELLSQLAAIGAHRAYAGIVLPNPASIALHESFGFTKVGHYHEVGFKFDQFWDVAWYELNLA